MSITKRQVSKLEELYSRYEPMATKYAKKVFNYERYGFEFEDIVQELRIKVYTSVITYAQKWAEYKSTGKYKPVPIEYYLKSAMNNKVKDFIKKFNEDLVENVDKISIESNSFDISLHTTCTGTIDYDMQIVEVNGVDLLSGLQGKERKCFCMFLKGFTVTELDKIFQFKVPAFLEKHVANIKAQRNQLFDFHTTEIETQVFEEA